MNNLSKFNHPKYPPFNHAGKLTVKVFGLILFLAFTLSSHAFPESEIVVGITKTDQQKKQVTGKVTDDTGEVLPGATVQVEGTSRGVICDIDGSFSIEVTPKDKLVVAYLGYETQVITVGNKSELIIVLKPKANELDDVTVVAFATQKKSSVIGAISTIKPAELKVPSSNLTTALAGRVAGMISYQRSGEPGQDNADFFIRGVTTFGYKVDPLILIDNVEVSTTELARIQVDDIASFSIMKDATSTALYGARGANGVILVTTKQGAEGKAKVNFRFENSISTPTRSVELADPITYMQLANEAVLTRNPLGITLYSDQKIDNTIAGINPYMYPATNWKDELMKNYAMNQRVNLNVSGGGKVARYYVAGSFNKENGILKVDKQNNFNNNIDLKSYTLRTNVNINVTPTTEMIVRLSGMFDDYTGPIDGGTSIYKKIMRTNPVLFPPYYPKDEEHKYVNHILFGNYEAGNYLNPYADMVKGYKEYSRSNMSAQFELKQNLDFITKGLFARGMLNTTRNAYYETTRAYTPFYYQAGSYDKVTDRYSLSILNEDGGTEYLNYNPGSKTVSSNLYVEASLNYDRKFKDKHAVNGLLVFQLKNNVTGNADNLQASLPFRNVGLSGRATYSFDDRYFTEFNFGYNGSERFYKSHRWGFFPSFGGAWFVSNEAFWNEGLKKVISKLKLKGTYGLVGNDAIGESRFLYLSNVNMSDSGKGAVFGRDNGYNKPGISLSRYSNDEITWETAKKTNLGLEITFFNSLELQAEIYQEHRENILMTRSATPATMGLSAQPEANIGEAKSKGIDLSLDYNQVINKNWWIQGRLNFTYATSKYIVYEEPTYDTAPWKSHVGYPLSQQWGYLAERLFVDDEEVANSPYQNFGEYGAGDIKYHDINGDGQITSLDQVPIGYPTSPEIVYGFGISSGYKNVDFSCFFQGLARESFWIDVAATSPFTSYTYNDSEANSGIIYQNQLLQAYADSHWSEDNRNLYALWPRLSPTLNTNNSQQSTWFMRNGSFLRLKSVEIGYTLPDSVKKKLGAGIRIYASGTNLLTFSKFKLWDPEMAGNGLGYPVQQVYNIGLNVTF
ncbi:SusC/RagA family TonB-linked outer membrane protein [Parabacteroides pacaensis]|uniref:SusC/RagA family TonB-linked outer membrane protein n=1 Tax=Parabacteroides pacaensis TaxID=2086575 RepID=UPI000D0EB915|nr:TonB-dependent receptor [Parabacteroides pacaensis]